MRDTRGITLIALVVTIIVLLILAGVTVYFTVNGGFIGKVEEARDKSNQAGQNEVNTLDQAVSEIDKYLGKKEESIPEEDLIKIEYEFDTSTGTITGIKDKASYYEGGWEGMGNTGKGDCILPGGTILVIPSQIDGVEVKAIVSKYGNASGVFLGCKNITKVIIPSTVTKIGEEFDEYHQTYEFAGCTSLKEIVIESENVEIAGNQLGYSTEKIIFTNITEENAPEGAPWGAKNTCQIIYKK